MPELTLSIPYGRMFGADFPALVRFVRKDYEILNLGVESGLLKVDISETATFVAGDTIWIDGINGMQQATVVIGGGGNSVVLSIPYSPAFAATFINIPLLNYNAQVSINWYRRGVLVQSKAHRLAIPQSGILDWDIAAYARKYLPADFSMPYSEGTNGETAIGFEITQFSATATGHDIDNIRDENSNGKFMFVRGFPRKDTGTADITLTDYDLDSGPFFKGFMLPDGEPLFWYGLPSLIGFACSGANTYNIQKYQNGAGIISPYNVILDNECYFVNSATTSPTANTFTLVVAYDDGVTPFVIIRNYPVVTCYNEGGLYVRWRNSKGGVSYWYFDTQIKYGADFDNGSRYQKSPTLPTYLSPAYAAELNNSYRRGGVITRSETNRITARSEGLTAGNVQYLRDLVGALEVDYYDNTGEEPQWRKLEVQTNSFDTYSFDAPKHNYTAEITFVTPTFTRHA